MSKRIMVVNDEQEILDLFREILTDEGYDVTLYSYGITDIDEFIKVNPDLIILDYIMGGEKMGWQMLQKLRMKRATERIPVIVCTASTSAVEEIQGHLLSKGVRVVPKPFDIDDLLQQVGAAFEDPQRFTEVP